jgi:predicted outer membrane repeat protein
MKKILSVLLLTLLIATLTGPIPAQAAGTTRYATPTGGDTGHCSTWATACTLAYALSVAESQDQVWVAEGTHIPGAGQEDTFSITSGIEVYGGFVDGGSFENRDWENNQTILSGNNNNYHVVTTSNTDNTTILDGFIIQNGVADGPELLDVGQSEDSEKDKKGGGIYNLGGSPTLRNLVIKDNYAEYDGGGLYNEDGSPLLENVRFENNQANPDYPGNIDNFSYGYGGGMQNITGSPILVDVRFSGNRAIRGGALSNINGSSPEITGETITAIFENNQATRVGGAIFNNTNSNPALTNVHFEKNQSGYSGGAIYTNNSVPSINRAHFIENKGAEEGAYFGGAIYYRFDNSFTGSPTPSIVNAIFYKNSAADGGGAVYLLRAGSAMPNLSITNATFYENKTRRAGGGLDGGAIAYDGNSTVTVKNAILWGNLSRTDGEPQPSQLGTGTGTANVTYSIVQGGWPGGTAILNADPRFVDPAAGNLKLQGSSPAIDAFTNTGCPTEDIEGTERPQRVNASEPICDMGAYEMSISDFTQIDVEIGGINRGTYYLGSMDNRRSSYPGINTGPLVVNSAANALSSMRVLYAGVSYSEMMGFPDSQVTNAYIFPWYNNVAMNSQLRVSNLGNQSTTIRVYLGNDPTPIHTYTLAAGQASRRNYAGRNIGPLRVESSTTDILSTIRVVYADYSYSELMGFPVNQLTNAYLFPWYNNVAMNSQLRVSNLGNRTTTIRVYLGSDTTPIHTYTLGAGQASRRNYTGRNSGPLRVVSSNTNILSTIRVVFANNSYSELMGYPANQLAQEYLYPAYDNVNLNSQLRVSNVGDGPTEISVYFGSDTNPIHSYTLQSGEASRRNYTGRNGGPLRVVSSIEPIMSTVRTVYSGNSYYEMTGLPSGWLSTQYWFPWYNNVAMNSELRIAVP